MFITREIYKIRIDAADEQFFYGVDIERNKKVLVKTQKWWRKKILIGLINDIHIDCLMRMKEFDIFTPYKRMGLDKCDINEFDPATLEAYENIVVTTNEAAAHHDFITLDEYESFMKADDENE